MPSQTLTTAPEGFLCIATLKGSGSVGNNVVLRSALVFLSWCSDLRSGMWGRFHRFWQCSSVAVILFSLNPNGGQDVSGQNLIFVGRLNRLPIDRWG